MSYFSATAFLNRSSAKPSAIPRPFRPEWSHAVVAPSAKKRARVGHSGISTSVVPPTERSGSSVTHFAANALARCAWPHQRRRRVSRVQAAFAPRAPCGLTKRDHVAVCAGADECHALLFERAATPSHRARRHSASRSGIGMRRARRNCRTGPPKDLRWSSRNPG